MTRAPTTLREHFRADPRGADSYPKWIEDRVWELLQRPAVWECLDPNGGGVEFGPREAHEHIVEAIAYAGTRESRRFTNTVRLLDGTVIKEWPAKET